MSRWYCETCTGTIVRSKKDTSKWTHLFAETDHAPVPKFEDDDPQIVPSIVANRDEPRWQEWRVTFVLRTDLRVPEAKRPIADAVEEFVTRAIDDANSNYAGEGEIDAVEFAVEKLGTVAS